MLDWAKLNDPAKQPVRTSKTVEDSGSDDTVKTPNGRRPLPVAVGRGGLVEQVGYLCRKCRTHSPSQPRTLCSVRPQCQHTVSMWRTIEACSGERARARQHRTNRCKPASRLIRTRRSQRCTCTPSSRTGWCRRTGTLCRPWRRSRHCTCWQGTLCRAARDRRAHAMSTQVARRPSRSCEASHTAARKGRARAGAKVARVARAGRRVGGADAVARARRARGGQRGTVRASRARCKNRPQNARGAK